MMGKTSGEGGIVQEQWVGSPEQKPLRKSVGKIWPWLGEEHFLHDDRREDPRRVKVQVREGWGAVLGHRRSVSTG